MFFGKKKVLGLDIGTTSIKVAELDVSKNGAKLINFAMTQTPPEAISSGEIVDVGPISMVIRNLLQRSNIKRKNVVAGLWGPAVIVKKITIPSMDESLVAEQIRWEAEQYIPFDLNDINLDFHIIGSTGAKNTDSMEILIVAAKHDQIFKYIEMIESVGLSCSHLDLNGFALANVFELNYGSTKGQMVGLFNIGANYTNFVVVRNSDPIFCRDINGGGHLYTSEIQKALGTSFEESEAIKLNMSVGHDTPEEAFNAVQSSHEVFIDELRGSVDFFINTTQGGALDRCYITGGGAKTWGLSDAISKGLNIPCEILNPFVAVEPRITTTDPTYVDQIREFSTIACGLGLRRVGDS